MSTLGTVLESTKQELSQARDESKQSEVHCFTVWCFLVGANALSVAVAMLGDVGIASGAAEAVRITGLRGAGSYGQCTRGAEATTPTC